MVVRFDSQAVQKAVENKVEAIGVEGDPPSKQGGLSEAESIVLESKKKLDESGEGLDRVPTELINEQAKHEPGPELNVAALREEALKAARKDGAS